jgi:hypothetical protein
MSSPQAAPGAAVLSPLRAEASRRNGAKSCGPKTPEGKARSAQNALKHGFRAQKHMVLPGEDAAELAALEAALIEELAPVGALQAALAQRVVSAVWRLSRAERLEAELFAHNHLAGRSLGLALIRDCNGARSFDTLLRYRGGTLAELWRALRTLKTLQAERQEARPQPAVARARLLPAPHETPVEPECRETPGDSARRRAESEPAPSPAAIVPAVIPCDQASARTKLPDEPESCGNPGHCGRPGGRAALRRGDPGPAEPAPPSIPIELARRGSACLLAGTALAPPGRRR